MTIYVPTVRGGLLKDAHIVRAMMRSLGRECTIAPMRYNSSANAYSIPDYSRSEDSLHVYLEVLPEEIRNARSIFIPNPEWFKLKWSSSISSIGAIFAKTREAHEIFKGMGANSYYIGFASADPGCSVDPHKPVSFLSLSGKSPLRQDELVAQAWSNHPEWPLVTIVSSLLGDSWNRSNVRILSPNYRSSEFTERLFSGASFHLCLSQTEGWGHYAVEALAAGAITLFSTCQPLRETLRNSGGLPVSASKTERTSGLATLYDVDSGSLELAVGRALAMSGDEREARSAQARSRFEKIWIEFRSRFTRSLVDIEYRFGQE
ncbi:glycosyltransferase family 4 protein [Microlunatus elymi]|uniref:Glycosyltransferase family 4 protein n=1 Tax=Microlunatus elymi TaxID=2596828 RepID=A0A516PUV8_9ACTN|nr:glycosyltransferase family 4 protein [Microlunatus elymi]QDP94974.1 glycosyltransferase family 4 protein [Microlunatus elymi]